VSRYKQSAAHRFNRFFQSLINASEPATETALPRPATPERNARREKARKRYIQVAALKTEAGITPHTANKKMTGHASLATGAIVAPAWTTQRLRSCPRVRPYRSAFGAKSGRKPRHVEEHEVESYAHRALAAHEDRRQVGSPHLLHAAGQDPADAGHAEAGPVRTFSLFHLGSRFLVPTLPSGESTAGGNHEPSPDGIS
jgi:hypothetical protein